MTQELRDQIDRDVRNGLYDVAVDRLKTWLSGCPEDIDAKMRLGVCSQLAGDDGACLRLYDEVQSQMELREATGEQSEAVSFWQKYRKLVAALLVVGVIPFCPAAECAPTNAIGGTTIEQRLCRSNSVAIQPAQSNVVDIVSLKNLPRGVQNIKYKDGVISTLVVVGKAAVTKALHRNPGRASQYDGERARSEAQLEFVRFLYTKCKLGKTSNGVTAMREETASATDAQGNETSADTSSFSETEMTKWQKVLFARACISGIQVLCEGVNDSGEYVWVGEWNAKNIRSIGTLPEVPQPPVAHQKYGGPMFQMTDDDDF